jgi:acetoacetyl-CoA reductase
MCKELFTDGYHVVGNYRNEAKAKEWQAQLKSEGYEVDIVAGDVCDFDSVGNMIKNIESNIGPIDVLVNKCWHHT